MEVIKTIKKIRYIVKKLKQNKKSIGFVPTMGALHSGHISLIKKARKENDIVVVSIFVNPIQFGPNEDYLRYPRPLNQDLKICKYQNVDIVFNPEIKEMYGRNHLTYVKVEKISDILCGKFRKGHFKGVATVVAKLFNIVQPDRAYFGLKDYQQLKIIQKMVDDLNFDIKIIPCQIIREKNGLAMSSRNTYLNEQERNYASRIYCGLVKAKDFIKKNLKIKKIIPVMDVVRLIRNELKEIPDIRIEYIKLCESAELNEIKKISSEISELVILVALWIGKTRLIDNIEIKL